MLQFPSFYATCHHCHERHDLGTLANSGVEIESGTNQREEDTVTFICPDCHKLVDNALVTR